MKSSPLLIAATMMQTALTAASCFYRPPLNITVPRPDVPFAPSLLPAPNPVSHADEIIAQFGQLTRSTSWKLVSKIPFEGDLWEPEGMVRLGDDRYFVAANQYIVRTEKYPDGQWINGTDRTAGEGFGHIVVFDGEGNRIADATVSEEGSTEYHLGGLDYDGTYIWAQLAEYRPNTTAVTIRVDPLTLETEYLFRVADHQGGIIHDTIDGTLTGLSWGGRKGYRFSDDEKTFAPLPGITEAEEVTLNPSHWVDYQDGKFLGHARAYDNRPVMLASGIASLSDGVEVGGVAIVDALTFVPLIEVPVQLRTDNGIRVTKNPVDVDVVDGKMRLYFLPEEGRSTLYVYEAE